MQRDSRRTLIDGAGTFGWTPGPFEATDVANAQMDACIRANAERVRAEPDSSALSFMVNAKNPIPESQIIANVKIAIGGGINEPRDALLTILYGLLTHPDQLDAVRAAGKWRSAFEEGVRWVAPIQVSSRLVMEDTEIRGYFIPKGDTVMTIQASANRDEDVFEDGENFNAMREPNPHQSFGNGPHHCAGRICRANAPSTILQRKGAKTGLITTRGFRDVLEIGRIRMPDMFDLTWDKPKPLVPRRHRLEVTERMAADGSVVTPLSEADVVAAGEAAEPRASRTVAIAFINSYRNAAHEQPAEAILKRHFPKLAGHDLVRRAAGDEGIRAHQHDGRQRMPICSSMRDLPRAPGGGLRGPSASRRRCW